MLYKKGMDIKKIRTILWSLVTISAIFFIAAYQIHYQTDKIATVVAKNFGGDFTLTNHLNQIVTQDDFSNQYRLIYFGFTYCPAICPTELQRISTILKELGSAGEDIQPIFITIDPERDTVETMKNYVGLFHPRLIGLTGTVEQIETVKKAYKIYAAKAQDETMNDYTMDHSSFIYFMGPDNSLIRIFKTQDSIEDMLRVIKKYKKSA